MLTSSKCFQMQLQQESSKNGEQMFLWKTSAEEKCTDKIADIPSLGI